MSTFKPFELDVDQRTALANIDALNRERLAALDREREVFARPELPPAPVHSREYNAGYNEGFKAGVEAALKLMGARHAG